MKKQDVIHRGRLEGVYGVARKLQAKHNQFETKCIGVGNCCRIGLVISVGECFNIAKSLREDYWKVAEGHGLEEADRRWEELVGNLKAAMARAWNPEDGRYVDKSHCVFYDNGCTIYDYRPLICRAYGVFGPVQEGECPRKRLPDGGHELIWDDEVKGMVAEFDSIVEKWGAQRPDLDFSVYMPAGILRFLLPMSEFQEIIKQYPDKFMGHKGYQHQMNYLDKNDVKVSIRGSK